MNCIDLELHDDDSLEVLKSLGVSDRLFAPKNKGNNPVQLHMVYFQGRNKIEPLHNKQK